MPLDSTERLYLERQVTLARVVLVALSLVALLETSREPVHRSSVAFLCVYLLVALGAVAAERFSGSPRLRIPLWADFVVLAAFLYLTPSVSAFWFLFLFAVFALANRGKTRETLALVVAATAGVILRVAIADPFRWQGVWHWLAIGLGTLVSGLCASFLGAREREHLAHQQFLEKITGVLHFERGLTESVRRALDELIQEFSCEQACLAVRDDEVERLFVWRFDPREDEQRPPETLSLSRSEDFLVDSLEVSLCWDFKTSSGFGWDRRTGRRVRSVPPPPEATREGLGAKCLLAATIETAEQPVGRVLLINPKGRACFSEGDLRWLEQIIRHLGPPLENIFLMRSLRTRAVESERSRISRDLHDGILQTLLSLNIQLDVLRRTAAQSPEKAAADLANLHKTIQQEGDEFRRMVTDMRPLRIESADMRELMFAFAERFRMEHDMAIELFVEDRDLRLPNRICRELFQIYRESLHNVKKHARASHVVVKLVQDEACVSLVVDDNGHGFSFTGRYSSEELDRLRLGPISIKERTRGVGGTLTVESNPGHGARLTVEIPLN
jgi:signal transduction histidine kinase